MGRSEINEQSVKKGFDALRAAKVSERYQIPRSFREAEV